MIIQDFISFYDNPRLVDRVHVKPETWRYTLFLRQTFNDPHVISIYDADTNVLLFVHNVDKWEQSHVDSGINFFFQHPTYVKNIIVRITSNDVVVFEKKQCIDAEILTRPTVLIERPIGMAGMGDYLFSTPTIRKLSNSFNEPIDVISRRPELFVNNPYVGNNYALEKNENIEYAFEKFNLKYRPSFFEIFPNHQNTNLNPNAKLTRNPFIVDLRQIMALDCGFHLTLEELSLDFFPNPFVPLHVDLPSKYIVINPYKTGIDRDIGQKNWQTIVDDLNNNGIPVVAIGLTGQYHDLNIKLGVNLCGMECQSDLSQTWHIINNATGFVSFDTGIYTLAGTTDAHLFLIDTYLNPEYHAPYRHGSNKYKLTIIKGTCQEYCLSNLRHYKTENGIWLQPYVQQCALYYDSFRCIPTATKISNAVIDHWRSL